MPAIGIGVNWIVCKKVFPCLRCPGDSLRNTFYHSTLPEVAVKKSIEGFGKGTDFHFYCNVCSTSFVFYNIIITNGDLKHFLLVFKNGRLIHPS